MNTTKKKLRDIKRVLKAGLKTGSLSTEEKEVLQATISEVIRIVEATPFYYQVRYTVEGNRSHMATYNNYAKRYKNLLYSNLQDMQTEVRGVNSNLKRCITLVTELQDTDFYRITVQMKIDSFQTVAGLSDNEIYIEKITVK